MSDSDNPFRLSSRARNQGSLGDMGDPERWGGYTEFTFTLPVGDNKGIYVSGNQIVRLQFLDLRARAVDIWATFDVTGQEPTLDGPWAQMDWGFTGFGLEIVAGVGQVTAMAKASPVFGVPVNPWVQTLNRGSQPATGVLQVLFPMPGVNLNIRPIFGLLTNDTGGVAHNITVKSTILVSPRA